MKPARFPLESVLHLYDAQEQQARAHWGQAVHRRQLADAALSTARAELVALTQTYREHRAQGNFSAGAHAHYWTAMAAGDAGCVALETSLRAATQAEAQMLSALSEARRRHEMLRKLHSRHMEKHRLAALRQEEHALADFFNANRSLRLRAEYLRNAFQS